MCYKSDNVDEHHFSFTSINAIQRYINSTWQRRLCRKKNHMTLFFAQLHILIIEKACGSCNFDFLFLFWNFGPLNFKKIEFLKSDNFLSQKEAKSNLQTATLTLSWAVNSAKNKNLTIYSTTFLVFLKIVKFSSKLVKYEKALSF